MKFFDIFDQLFQPCCNGIAAVTGIVAVKSIKNNGFVAVLVFEITLHHGEFIEIREQSQVLPVHNFSSFLLFVTVYNESEELTRRWRKFMIGSLDRTIYDFVQW